MRSQLLYCNQVTQRPSLSVSGDTHTFPTLQVGKQYSFSLRFLDNLNGQLIETFPKIRAIRANVGFDDFRPTAGTVKVQVGPGASTGDNTTAALNFNESGDALKNKLNALVGITPHDFTVESDSGSYFVRRASGEDFTLTVRENLLKPVSFVRVRKWQDTAGWVTELRFVQSPLAFTDTAAPVLPPKPYFEPVVNGVDYGDGLSQNEVQNLVIPRAFRGHFYVWYKKTALSSPVRTQLFSRADGVAQYEAALNLVMAPDGGKATVTNPETGKARFEFGGDLAGWDLPLLTVEVPTEGTPPGDWTFLLDLNTVEAWRAVLATGAAAVPFSLEIDVPEVEGDDESPSKTIPVWDFQLSLKRPLTFEGLATAQPVSWLRKPNPKTYLPYNQTQVGAGQFYYSPPALLGDGEETHFEIDHNLGVPALTGLCVQDVTDGRVLKESEYEIHVTNAGDSLEIDFVAAPAASSILVTLATPQPLDLFVNDLEVEIAQVVGLGDVITNLTGRVTDLEAVLPGTGPAATASQASGIEIELPETQEVLFFKGVTKDAWGEDGPDASKLGRAPLMLPAVHDATVTSYTTGDLPAIAADSVWSNDSSGVLEMGRGIYGGRVLVSGFFASDGRVRYAARRDATTTSYFPTGFDRELWRIFINDKMLRVNRTLDVQWGLALQLVGASSNAQWVLVVEKGTAPSQATPATTGTNLENVAWDATPILSQRIILTGNRQTHSFGVRIKRSLVALVDTLTMDTMLYGVWEGNNAAAPAAANFALRARLINFDTENALAADARGWVTYEVIGPAGEEEEEDKPKATIS